MGKGGRLQNVLVEYIKVGKNLFSDDGKVKKKLIKKNRKN